MVALGCGGIIIEDGKVLLMLRRGTETFDDIWSNPGGTIEDGEDAETAMIRELRAELGIKVSIVRRLKDYYHHKEDTHVGTFSGFLVEIVEGTPTLQEPDKAAELRYFPLDALPENIAPYTVQYIKEIIGTTQLDS